MTKLERDGRSVIRMLVATLALSVAQQARAESVLFLSAELRTPELFEALELALRGYGPLVTLHRAPEGESEGARLASAQRLGTAAGASVAVWVEHVPPARVRALAPAQPERPFDAPLPEPLAQIEPRVFGSIAASLVLQALRGLSVVPAAAALQTADNPEPAAPAKPPAPREPRFFLRPAFALGTAFVGQGHEADRHPSVELVTEAQEWVEEGRADAYLYENGYDCDVTHEVPLVASNCKVAVGKPGVVYSPVFDVAAGVRVWRSLALALTLRFNPNAGQGTLAASVIGTEVSWSLVPAPQRGLFVDVQGGFGFGQIQVRPGTDSQREGPYVSSGPFNLRAGVLAGYRFLPRFGLFAGLTLHGMLPDTLWVLDPKVGVELRL
jgi:hypothetical protein